MKSKKIITAIFLLTGFLFLWSDTIDRIVAKVGREVILESELEKRFNNMEAMHYEQEEFTKEDILQEMIESELILIKGRESGIEVDEFEIKKIAEQQIESIRQEYKSEIDFRQDLKMQTSMSVKELQDYYEDMIKNQKIRDELISQNIVSQIHVTNLELEEYYNEHLEEMPLKEESDKIGMILMMMKPSAKTREARKKKLFDIKDQLNKGGDFAELARKYSDCPSSEAGGDLGFIDRGITVKPFEDVAFSLEPGEISGLVETQFGFHLIYVQERKEDQVKVSHILLNLEASEEDRANTLELAQNIQKQLIDGADFASLAREYSEDDSSAAQGGVIGEFPSDEYPELFSSDLQSLDYGEVSKVISQQDNLYIFKKIEKVSERRFTYQEMYDEIKNKLYYQKQAEIYIKWIDNLKKEIYIEIFL